MENLMENKKVKRFDPKKISFLVVDDDPSSLKSVVRMLEQFYTQVYGCTSAIEALELLRGTKSKSTHVDIVLADVHMPDINGFKLLEIIGLEMEIPVVLMSAEGTNSNVLKGVTYGAVDFLPKPIRSEDLQFLWQHALSKLVCEEKQKHKAKKSKKPRMIWTPELHQRFVNAVNSLGLDKAVPKKIKELMKVQFLQREHIASHLQKYRLFLKQSPKVVMPHLEPPPSVMKSEQMHLQHNQIHGLPQAPPAPAPEPIHVPPQAISLPTPTLHLQIPSRANGLTPPVPGPVAQEQLPIYHHMNNTTEGVDIFHLAQQLQHQQRNAPQAFDAIDRIAMQEQDQSGYFFQANPLQASNHPPKH